MTKQIKSGASKIKKKIKKKSKPTRKMAELTEAEIARVKKLEDANFEKSLERIANAYKFGNIIKRGLLTGIFTAVGATVGFAVLILTLAKLYSGLSNFPLLNDFMEVTGLDVVVEYALEQTGQGDIDVADTIETP